MGNENDGIKWKTVAGTGAITLGSVVALVTPSSKVATFLQPASEKLAELSEHVPVLNKIENPTYRLAALGVPVALGGLALMLHEGKKDDDTQLPPPPANGNGRGGRY